MQQDLAGAEAVAEALATELRIEFAKKGTKQYVVARRLGISGSQLSGYLTGRLLVDQAMADRIRQALAEVAA